MMVKLVFAALLALPLSRAVQAQTAAPPTAEQQFIGTWDGLFQSDHVAPGLITLRISADSTWRVATAVQVGQELFSTVGYDVTLEGDTLSWSQETMGQTCRGTVTLQNGKLVGETSCGGSGLSFALSKRVPGASRN